MGSGDSFGSWLLDGVGRLVGFRSSVGLTRGFGLALGLGKWPTFRSTVPALSFQIEGFALPVAAVAVSAAPAATIATRAGAKRQARLSLVATPMR